MKQRVCAEKQRLDSQLVFNISLIRHLVPQHNNIRKGFIDNVSILSSFLSTTADHQRTNNGFFSYTSIIKHIKKNIERMELMQNISDKLPGADEDEGIKFSLQRRWTYRNLLNMQITCEPPQPSVLPAVFLLHCRHLHAIRFISSFQTSSETL